MYWVNTTSAISTRQWCKYSALLLFRLWPAIEVMWGAFKVTLAGCFVPEHLVSMNSHRVMLLSVTCDRFEVYWPAPFTALSISNVNELRGQMVIAPTSYSGGLGFESRTADWLSWYFRNLPQSLEANVGMILKIDHGRFSSTSFLIHYLRPSYYSTLY